MVGTRGAEGERDILGRWGTAKAAAFGKDVEGVGGTCGAIKDDRREVV